MIKGLPKNTEFKNLFIELVKLYKPNTYMELGTKKCYMFNTISKLVKIAIAIDCCGFPANVNKIDTYLYNMTTDDAFLTIKNRLKPIVDFLFIDACHEKEQVLKDFNNYSQFVREGTGLIFLHDTHPISSDLLVPGYCHNSCEAAWEIRTNEKYKKQFEIVTLPGPWFGLSIIRKSIKQLSWEINK